MHLGDIYLDGRSQVKVKCSKIGQKLNNGSYLKCYLTHRLHTWYQITTLLGAFNDPSDVDIGREDQWSRSNFKECVKIGHGIP